MNSQLRKSEVTRAVNRYARRHTMFANTVRTISSVKRHAIVEWLEATNDPRLPLWLPSVTCKHPSGCSNKQVTSDVLCEAHRVNQCDGCRAGHPIVDGNHVTVGGFRSYPYMVCQKGKYA